MKKFALIAMAVLIGSSAARGKVAASGPSLAGLLAELGEKPAKAPP